MPRGRPRTLLAVPCDTHGSEPCPSPNGCLNRRERAGLTVARKLGKREAQRIAAAQVAGWTRAALEAGAEITGPDGALLDPESREWGLVRDAVDALLAELDERSATPQERS